MTTLHEMLGIDESDGIEPTEVEAIKNTLARIKVVAAGVAKDNDAPTTLAILRTMEDALRRAAQSHSVDEATAAFGGTSPKPVAAIGGGSAKTPEQQALDTILNSSAVPAGLKMALRRMAVPSDPDYIKVEDDGTPSEVAALRKQVADLTKQRDDNKAGADSFVQLLDAVKAETGTNPNPGESEQNFVKRAVAAKLAATPAGANSVKKADVKAKAEAALAKVNALTANAVGTKINGKDEAVKAVEEVLGLAS